MPSPSPRRFRLPSGALLLSVLLVATPAVTLGGTASAAPAPVETAAPGAAAPTPTLVAGDVPATVTAQYSDSVTFSFAVTGGRPLSTISATATGLPTGLALTKKAGGPFDGLAGNAAFDVKGTVQVGPGTYPVSIVVTDGSSSETKSVTVVVTPESATVSYTGEATAVAGTSGTGAVAVTLKAAVQQVKDDTVGDLTTATVTFTDTTTGTTLCASAVDLGGVARCSMSADAPRTYAVRSTVGGFYTGVSASDSPLAVTVPTVPFEPPVGPPVTPTDPSGDTSAPNTVITTGPANGSTVLEPVVTFDYAADETASSYRCVIDSTPVACAGTTVRLDLAAATPRTHVFSVAAVDAAGNVDTTPATRTFTLPASSKQLKRVGKGWKNGKDPKSFRGRYVTSKKKGATLTYDVTAATSLSLVVSTGRRFGAVKVLMNGRMLKRVSLAGKPSSSRIIRVSSFGAPVAGKITVFTVNRKPVRIEGLVVTTTP